MAKTPADTNSKTEQRPKPKKRHLPPGLHVSDVVWAVIPCAMCADDEDCRHYTDELAVIHAATERHLALDVIRSAPNGRLGFTLRVVGWSPEDQFTRLAGQGAAGALAHWFTGQPAAAEPCLDGYQGIRYDVERIHAANGADLFRLYLETLAPHEAFALLEFSVRTKGHGNVLTNVGATDWAKAFAWRQVATMREDVRMRARDAPSPAQVDIMAMRLDIVSRLTRDRLLEYAAWALERLDLERSSHLTAAVALIAIAWSELRDHKHPLDDANHLLATRLLHYALQVDRVVGRPPLFWMALEPLEGMDAATHYGLVRKSFLARARSLSKDWTDVYAYVREMREHPQLLAKLGLSKVAVDQLWLEAWKNNWNETIFEDARALVPMADRELAKRWTIARLQLFSRFQVERLLDVNGDFWRSLDPALGQLLAEAVARMALDAAVAAWFRHLPLPVELRTALPDAVE